MQPRETLASAIDACMLVDRWRLRRRLAQLNGEPAREAELQSAIAASSERRARRAALLPKPQYDPELPVVGRREEIADAIARHQVVVICGETGSGKTTQLPKICLELGRGIDGLIGHTQPRRIAARSVAQRIASELRSEVGHAVGYKIRFSDRVSPDSYLKLMTDGILLAEIPSDRYLNNYDTLIIDEAHERSLNIDFLLGCLKSLLPKRRDLKLIITSATIDTERFSKHFQDAPVIEVSGRTYPVEVRYRPVLGEDADQRDRDLYQALLDAVDEVARLGPGDILVFLPGEREIRLAAEALRKHHPPHTEVLPLFSRLSTAEQNRVFQPHIGRRIVLATNVAETSLTVPGVRTVIDTGLARISRVSRRSKIQRLPIEAISQSSARQRAGRCGRLGPGVCIRLYDEQDFLGRPLYTEPEILRTNLAAVILQMQALKLGDVAAFPFIDPPGTRQISDGYKLLEELGAVTKDRKLTALGTQLARLPVDPRIGRMVLAAKDHGCLSEVLIIASALSIQDPRERPLDAQQAADAAQQRFRDERSDFLAYLKLWAEFEEQVRHLSQNKLRQYCKANFLSYVRMQEWRDIHRQILSMVKAIGMHLNEQAAEYVAVHRALLSGLLGNIAFAPEPGQYTGAYNMKMQIFPGSSLFKKNPKWIFAAEIVDTSKPYARCVAKIEPEWIEPLAKHLVNRGYFEPHWEKKPARVAAFERVSLFGLTLVAKRRVNYGPINPAEARMIFIRAALVNGEFNTSAPFFAHNRALVQSVEALEHKSRRHDILVSEEDLFRCYDQRIPASIYCGADFDKWCRAIEQEQPQALFFALSDLMRHDASAVTAEQFPDHWIVNDMRLPLRFHFAPGAPDDGVTLSLPLAALNQIDAQRAEWLVPGLLHEKLMFLIRALPKALRRNFVPAPNFADACLQALTPADGALLPALVKELKRMTGVAVPEQSWAEVVVPDHLRMNFRIVDESGAVLAQGRDLDGLRQQWAGRAEQSFRALPDLGFERAGLKDWNFYELPAQLLLERNGIQYQAYPALVDKGECVDLRLLDSADKARHLTQAGLRRLFILRMPEQVKYLRKQLPGLKQLTLYYTSVPPSPWTAIKEGGSTSSPGEQLLSELIAAAFDRTFLGDRPLIRDRSEFEARLEAGRAQLIGNADALARQVLELLAAHHQILKRLTHKVPLTWMHAVADVREQLQHLVYRGFIMQTPPVWWLRLPRYLQAIGLRLDRMGADPQRDRNRVNQIAPFWERCRDTLQRAAQRGRENPTLEHYRWMLEEFRVSLFAQEIKTVQPVSASRLEKLWEELER